MSQRMLLSFLFLPLSALYAFFAQISFLVRLYRSSCVSRGCIKKPLLISIGNIAVGGRGKTPVTIAIAKLLEEKGLRFAVIMRGIGRASNKALTTPSCSLKGACWQQTLNEEGACFVPKAAIDEKTAAQKGNHQISAFFGDEASLCANRLGDKKVVIAPKDRLQGLQFIERHLDVDVVLFDDALQCQQVPIDLHLVLMGYRDLTPINPLFAFLRYLPFSTQRIATQFLRRASYLLLQHHAVPKKEKQQREDKPANLIKRLAKLAVTAPLIDKGRYASFQYAPRNFERVRDGEKVALLDWKKQFGKEESALVCAIANPSSFFATLKEIGIEPTLALIEKDHTLSSLEQWERVCQNLLRSGIKQVIITEKDAVKLKGFGEIARKYGAITFYALIVEVEMEERFKTFLNEKLENSLLVR